MKAYRIAKDTFLGNPNDDDAKTTFCVSTEECMYLGPSLAECERMRAEYKDNSPIQGRGYLPAESVQGVGNWLASIGLQFVFKGGK